MSPKNSSLAFDETLKDLELSDYDTTYAPELKVIVNNQNKQTSFADVIQIEGRITVSF